MNELTTAKTMTVKEVAAALNVSEDSVLRATKEKYPEIVKNGKTTLLTEIQVTAVKLVIEKHHNLRTTAELPKTDLEMMLYDKMVSEWKDRKIEELKTAVSLMQPKAESFDKFLSAKNSQPVGDVAKMLNIGRNKFFAMLRKDKILDTNNTPYQSHMKYFEVIDKPVKIKKEIVNIAVTMIKPEGIDYLSKRYEVKKNG